MRTIRKNHSPAGLRALALAALFLIIAVAVTACFSPLERDGEGTITINFGGNGRAAAWPPDNARGILPALDHRVTLKGPTGTQSHIIEKGTKSASFVVAKGFWNVEVEALYGSYRYAAGSGGANVKGGLTSLCSIMMNQAERGAVYLAASNKAEWDEACNEISNGVNNRNYVILVTNDFEVDSLSTVSAIGNDFNGTVTICGEKTISLSLSSDDALLIIYANQTFIVYDTKLKGRTSNNSSVVYIEGTFIMEGNSSVFGNISSSGGGGVYVNGGDFTMLGNASVTGNTSTGSFGGGGVMVNEGNFVMQGSASVSGNSSSVEGGGVYVNSSRFTMSGSASVSGNTAETSGGGVFVNDNGIFQISGGTVYGNNASPSSLANSADAGAALCVEITTNTAIAQYGNGTTWTDILGSGDTGIDATIKVVNGALVLIP
jgi:hypothetical protein